MKRSIIFIFCALQFVIFVQSSGLYSVIGPGTIRSNFKYNVAVSVHKADGPCKLKIAINGPSYNESKEIEVEPMSTENVEFEIPKLSNGDYNLTATGISGIIFENSTKLNYADFKPSVFIQTDKATYKPGDVVKFRVLFLDENTRPAKIAKPVNLVINDGAQNRIKQVKNIEITKGVYTGELQLSEQPVLGNWNIGINDDDAISESKSFEVAKYVLPKYEVIIDTSRNVAKQDGVIKATIRAKYTYGKPVKGKARVTLKPNHFYYMQEDKVMQDKTIDINGKGHVEFDISSLVKDENRFLPNLNIFAEVEEELTGNKYNTTTNVELHSQRYRIEGVDNPSSYHPGKTFTYKVVVKNVDDKPVLDTKNKVKLTFEKHDYYYFGSHRWGQDYPMPITVPSELEEKPIEFESNLDEKGFATFEVTLPETDKQKRYSVRANFLDSKSYLSSISTFKPEYEEPELLKVQINTKNAQLGKDVSFEVKSTEDIPYFVYTIVARGNIIKSEHVEVPKGRKTHTIKFTPTFAMIPKATIYVHYIKDNNLQYKEKEIQFEKNFENSLEIDAPIEAKPSEEVQLKIKTDPDSYVGLLGVDQSVLLLKSGNDLDKNSIFSSLDKYTTSTPWQQGYGTYPGEVSGLVTLTNANYPYNNGTSNDWLEEIYELEDTDTVDSIDRFDSQLDETIEGTQQQEQELKQNIIRKNFAEIFIWQEHIYMSPNSTEADGFTLAKKIPDTITSWVVTGFSLNPKSGIALTEEATKIRVFQPFFISTNLPYSVKRGEVISIPVIIFNYMEKALDAEITMDNSDGEYEFTEATNEVDEKPINEIKRVKRITVPSNNGQSVSFMIRPKKVGTTTLKITAVTPLAGDAIHQKLKVEPEGITQFVNKAAFINLNEQPELNDKIDVNVPEEAVPDSEYIEFSVVGDLLGPTIKNLDNLVRMPYGCGEQNMVNFVPNILVLKYLEATNQPKPGIAEKAKKFLEIGYQRELTYKHDDGSYSAFGKSDASGSTWLTAYVMRSFHQAAKYTDVDPEVMKQGLDFLAAKQLPSGEFPEVGKLFDSAHQNALGLTSFVLLAFFENEEFAAKYEKAIEKGLEYVATEVDKTDDQYSLAIAAVALQLAKHPASEKLLAKLNNLAKQEDNRKWWSKSVEKSSSKPELSLYDKPRSNDVEITSYILLALLEKEPAEAALPIIKWLIAQRNSNGGFASTQDTVIGLQALTKFAYKTGSGNGDIDIEFVSTGGDSNNGNFKVNPENSLVLQTHVLPKSVRQVSFTAKGKGTAMVQLSYRYNLADKEKKPSFKIEPKLSENTTAQQLKLDICTQYTPTDSNNEYSNMVVMEIELPSGYTTDAESLALTELEPAVSRVESQKDDTKVIVYFDRLKANKIECLPVQGSMVHAVAKQKPVPVSVYDYYDTERRATEYYKIESSLCDICQGDDCGDGCKKN